MVCSGRWSFALEYNLDLLEEGGYEIQRKFKSDTFIVDANIPLMFLIGHVYMAKYAR